MVSSRATPKPLRDVIAPGLRMLFCGINPSLRSAQAGHHFARPGNRFWPALAAAGITPRRLGPDEDGELPALGVGITNLADRPTRAASELSEAELRGGAAALGELVARYEPRLVAIVGVTAYRTAFGHPGARFGLQAEPLGGRPVWVLPNPSGLNAHVQVPQLAAAYGEAWHHAGSIPQGSGYVTGA
jgi:TDG/mug DNA glycosylase family protein